MFPSSTVHRFWKNGQDFDFSSHFFSRVCITSKGFTFFSIKACGDKLLTWGLLRDDGGAHRHHYPSSITILSVVLALLVSIT